MPNNILDQIINKRIKDIDEEKKKTSIKSINESIEKNTSYIDFKKKIVDNSQNEKISIIAEVKKASPSAGIIIKDYNPLDIAKIYNKNKATCLSVLTEPNFFHGKMIDIQTIKKEELLIFFMLGNLLTDRCWMSP